jgi:hypothetical protein
MLSSLHSLRSNAAHVVTSFNSNAKRRPKYVLMLLLPFFAILAQAPFVALRAQVFGPLIVKPRSVCGNTTTQTPIVITIFASGFSIDAGFTAYLSDASGNFSTSPTIIGTATTANISNNQLTINANIPGSLTVSDLYKIVIVSSGTNEDTSKINHFSITDQTGPTITLTSTDVSSCRNDSDGSITGTANGGLAPFFWSARRVDTIPIQFVPMSSNGNIGNANNLRPGTYDVFATDGNACEGAESATLIQIPLPSIEVSTLQNVSSCGTGGTDGGGIVTLRVFPRNGIIATAIKPYFFQAVPQATDTTGVPYVRKPVPVTFNDLAIGSYKVTMKDGAGCESNMLQNIVIGKDSPLVITLSGWGNPTTCNGDNGDITVLDTGGSHSLYRYSLSTDGGVTYGPIQSGRRFGGLTAGDYVIKGMDSRGCFDTLHKTLNNPKGCTLAVTGSTDGLNLMAKNALGLQVFPNPTRTSFTLSMQSSSKESVQIIVTDMVGKKLYQTTGNGSRQYTFGSEFSSGMYIVQVIQGKQVQTLKLVKGN